MKYQLKPFVVTLCLLGFVTPILAETDQSQTKNLEKKLAQVENEIAVLKHQLKNSHSQKKTVAKKYNDPDPQGPLKPDDVELSPAMKAKVEAGQEQSNANRPFISGPSDLPRTGYQYFPMDIDVPGQSFVSTGPYIGVPLQFSGSDLVINNPSVNQDVALLNLRKNITCRLAALGLKPQERSHLILSGIVEGQGGYRNIGGSPDGTDIDLTSAGIDAYILGASNWISGLISLNYDNSIGATTGAFSNFSRTFDSRVYVNKAFIVVGDFTKSPIYGTLGQMYVPFGQYSSTMISSNLPKLMARTQARAALIGFQQQRPCALYGSAFLFRGDSHVGHGGSINNGGLNAGYKFVQGDCSGNIGASIIANIADSQGMQDNGLSVVPPPQPLVFTGFGGVSGSGSENLAHRVPAFDLRALFSIGKRIDLLAEYVTATTSFSKEDMTMNGHGARPRALNAEATYTFQDVCYPTSVSVGYGFSKDTLALGLPIDRYSAVVNTSFWRNTLQSLEFRHDINYAASQTATGSEVHVPSASGQSDNIITAQFDIYF